MQKEAHGRYALAILVGLLAARALRAFLSSLSWHSLVTLRLNESAAWTLLLLLPLLLPRRFAWHATLLALAASVAMAPARFTPWYVPVSGLAAAAALAAALRLPSAGAAVGIALDAGLLLAGGSRDPTLGAMGAAALGLLGAAALAHARPRASPEADAPLPRARDGLAFALLLGVELAFLASPFALARWLALPAWLAGLVSLASFVAGATRGGRSRLLLALGALGVLDVALVGSPLALLSLALAQAALGSVAARLVPEARAATIAFAPLAFLLTYFAQPFGLSDRALLLPTLALAALGLAFAAAPPKPRPRLHGAIPTAALAALVLVAAMPAPAARIDADERDERTLRVVTWNVRQGFGNRGALDIELYAGVLRALEPDAVLLQESGPPALSSGGVDVVFALGRALGMRASHGEAGAAILSRHPFVEERPPSGTWTHEAAIDAEGDTVWLHAVHLGRSPEARREQALSILAARDERPGPRVVAGDMNACPAPTCFRGRPSDGTYEILAQGLADAWVAAGNARDDPAGNTHPSWAPSRRIDQVFVHGLDVLDARPVRTPATALGSDHLPVLVEVRLRGVPES